MNLAFKFSHFITLCIFIWICSCGVADRKQLAMEEAPVEMDASRKSEPTVRKEQSEKGTSDMVIQPQKEAEMTTAGMNLGKSGKRFIKTADLRFRVKSVQQTSRKIEDLVTRFNGFVTQSDLKSQISYSNDLRVSKDSSLRVNYYFVANEMTLRVPQEKLDSFLRALPPLISYLEYRHIKAQDVDSILLANQLKAKRLAEYERRMNQAIDKNPAKLNEISDAQNSLLDRQNQADEKLIETLSIEDRIKYSTVKLSFNQNLSIFKEMVPRYNEYKIPFWERAKDAFYQGWEMLQELVLFFFQSWFLILLALVLYFVYQRFLKSYIWKRGKKAS